MAAHGEASDGGGALAAFSLDCFAPQEAALFKLEADSFLCLVGGGDEMASLPAADLG